MIIEIIVTSASEAKLAEEYGAHRLELIHAFEHGGLSPDLSITQEVCDIVHVPVNVMLRCSPHVGFIYTSTELDLTLRELEFIWDFTKANGIVFGALDKNGTIDINALKLIIANKGHLKLTLHRAIDVSTDIISSYHLLLDTQAVDWVLTSGGADTAMNGVNMIKQMISIGQNSANARIIAGSGITPDNAKLIENSTGVTELHIGTGVRSDGRLNKVKFDELLSSQIHL